MMGFEIVSRENIKPSSPTPEHLKTFNLPVLHQLIPAPYAPIIFYYRNYNNASDVEVQELQEQLKRSLSEALTHFYPLAGTVKDDLTIECDDVGADYVVARVNKSLHEFLKHLDLDSINRFLPCDPTFSGPTVGVRVTNVQVNVFDCGGFAISLCISHKILDGTSLATFLKCWAALQRLVRSPTFDLTDRKKSEEVMYPDLTTPFLPATETWLRDLSFLMWASLIKIGKCSTRRFIFGHSAIATLKTEVVKNKVQHPTRVEVVTALLWKCAMAATTEKSGFKKRSLLSHVVDLRKRSGTTLSRNTIGNLVWLASTECGNMSDMKLHDIVNQVRGSISEISNEFVGKLQGDNVSQVMEESIKRLKDREENEKFDYIGFTSWCKMGFYDVDFGWGKPIWVSGHVSHGSPVFTDFVVLMDTRCGDGIEAWVNMNEHEMQILEQDPELLAFASLDPSPLQICEVAIY